MKKFFVFLLLIIAGISFYYYREYSKYFFLYSCVVVVEHGKAELSDENSLNKLLVEIKNEENMNCLVLDSNKAKNNYPVPLNFRKEISGIKYRVVYTTPEKKNDDHLEKISDENINDSQVDKHSNSFEPDVKHESSNITVVLINGSESDGYTKEEIFDSIINAQTLFGEVHLLITDGFTIPDERILKDSLITVNTNGKQSVTLIKYKIIVDENKTPSSIETTQTRTYGIDIGKM